MECQEPFVINVLHFFFLSNAINFRCSFRSLHMHILFLLHANTPFKCLQNWQRKKALQGIFFQIQDTYESNFSLIINVSRLLIHENSHVSWPNTGYYAVKMCSQKFDLHVQFIMLLNAFPCVRVRARAV